jgi:hypothetical protein
MISKGDAVAPGKTGGFRFWTIAYMCLNFSLTDLTRRQKIEASTNRPDFCHLILGSTKQLSPK